MKHVLLALALVVGGPAIAAAQPAPAPADPAPPRAPGLTLPAGKVSGTVTLEVNASQDAFAEPVSIAPDVHYGVTDDLTLSLIHSTFGTIGFRGNAGRGLCVTGEDNGCGNGVYDNVGVEGLYSLVRGPTSVAANLGYHAWSLEAGHHAIKVGAKLRHKAGAITVASVPSVFVAVTERDDELSPQPDRLYVPVTVAYAFTPAVAAGLGTGLKGPLDNFGDAYEIALGVFGTYAIDPRMSVGASWVHGKIVGGEATLPEGTSGLDYRAIHVWFTFAP